MLGLDSKPPIPLIASYVLDWVIIIATAGVSTVLGDITPNKRPFSLVDLTISFPYTKETIPTWLLMLCSLFAPAVIIVAVCLLVVPSPRTSPGTSKALLWRRKLWEWHAGWLGLALSVAAAYLLTSGAKNLFGKPRPDLLARYQPDLGNISQYAIGGYADLKEGVLLVSADVCKNADKKVLDDGFRSFPSGHSSFSAAGLVYLSLWLAAKFAVAVPFLSAADERLSRSFADDRRHAKRNDNEAGGVLSVTSPSRRDLRTTAAAPPAYLLLIVAVPTLASIYISATRFSDFRHHGFDVLFGFLIGSVTAYFAFRFYHPAMARSGGWSWATRHQHNPFWLGVGETGWGRTREDAEYESRYDARNDGTAHDTSSTGEERLLRLRQHPSDSEPMSPIDPTRGARDNNMSSDIEMGSLQSADGRTTHNQHLA